MDNLICCNNHILISQLQEYLGELYVKEGLTQEVLKLSQELDMYLVEEQLKQVNNKYSVQSMNNNL